MQDRRMEYKGYCAGVTYDVLSGKLRGILQGIGDYVDFSADSMEELEQEFHMAVDDYLEFCHEVGKVPCKGWNGIFCVKMNSSVQS